MNQTPGNRCPHDPPPPHRDKLKSAPLTLYACACACMCVYVYYMVGEQCSRLIGIARSRLSKETVKRPYFTVKKTYFWWDLVRTLPLKWRKQSTDTYTETPNLSSQSINVNFKERPRNFTWKPQSYICFRVFFALVLGHGPALHQIDSFFTSRVKVPVNLVFPT